MLIAPTTPFFLKVAPQLKFIISPLPIDPGLLSEWAACLPELALTAALGSHPGRQRQNGERCGSGMHTLPISNRVLETWTFTKPLSSVFCRCSETAAKSVQSWFTVSCRFHSWYPSRLPITPCTGW